MKKAEKELWAQKRRKCVKTLMAAGIERRKARRFCRYFMRAGIKLAK